MRYMSRILRSCQHVVATVLVLSCLGLPLHAQQSVPEMLEALQSATPEQAKRLEREILARWSQSGSASMDLLLRRGRAALEEEDDRAAIAHFTALTDHAPDFAEGWHGLARAYFAADLYGPTIDALGRTLALNPDHFPALFGLGALFQQFGDYSRSAEAYRQVLNLHPHHEDAQEALQSLMREGVGRTL